MMSNWMLELVEAAAREAGRTASEICVEKIRHEDELTEIVFTDEWMRYDCYVDNSLFVPGFFSEPLDFETVQERLAA